ncbi:MAG: penicillin-binding protein 2 [Firmicutes bacterium]|nr:penicillin-binding protein 2 [Bacillota bacterium]
MVSLSPAQVRLKYFGYLVMAVILVLASRLWYLQVVQGSAYEALSLGNRVRVIPVAAPRGKILDRNDIALASNRLAFCVSVVPQDLSNRQATIAWLSQVLELTPEGIEQKLSTPGRPFEPIRIKADVDPGVVVTIGERRTEFPGVIIEEVPVRNYVLGDTAGHILGYTREIDAEELKAHKSEGYKLGDQIGKVGVEKAFEEYLRGTDGGEQVEVNSLSQPIRVLGSVAPVSGYDVVLTIDSEIQVAAEKALEAQLDELAKSEKTSKAQAGVVIAMDPRTGEILAMASKPSYDPNMFVGELSPKDLESLMSSPSPQPNRAISHTYAPGSTFKVMTVLAALEQGKVDLGTRFFCTGRDSASGKACWTVERGRSHGALNIIDGISESCNIVFYELGRRVGIDDLAQTARMFGLGQPTGIILHPKDQAGLVPDREWKMRNFKGYDRTWYPTETLDVAIGQGALLVTPLQLANVYSAIAQRGILRQPMIVKTVLDPDGRAVKEFQPAVVSSIPISSKSWDILEKGLESVVSRGTARGAFIGFPLRVAGKTGTAQNPQGPSHAWFACYAPIEEPEIVVLVMIEHGSGGAAYAAPVARQVLEEYFGISYEEAE